MKDVLQKQLEAGVETTFTMELERAQFLVKNFTGGNIRVRLGNNTSYSTIGSLGWERVFNNINNAISTIPDVTKKVHITADVPGLVEVASID